MHPINADPDLVESQALEIAGAADEIRDAAQKLFALAYGPVQSHAIDAMQANVEQLASVLTDAHVRYEAAGAALSQYAPVLRAAQQEVNEAIVAMSHTDVSGASHQAWEAEAKQTLVGVNPLASQSDRDEASLNLDHAKEYLYQQELAANAAQSKYDSAVADLHQAAMIAAAQIENGIEMSHLNDTFWDHCQRLLNDLHSFMSTLLKALYDILDEVSTALAIVGAAIVAAGVLTGDPVLAGFGAAVLGVSDVLSDVELGVQVLRYLDGDISFGEVMSAVIMTIATMLLTKLGGKLVAKAADSKGLWSHLFTPELAKDDGADDHLIGYIVDEGGDAAEDPLGKFIDDHVQVPVSITRFLEYGQWQVPGRSNDVGLLTPDFSKINVSNIMKDAFAESAACQVHAAVYPANVGV